VDVGVGRGRDISVSLALRWLEARNRHTTTAMITARQMAATIATGMIQYSDSIVDNASVG
jgi:hypothetical protein